MNKPELPLTRIVAGNILFDGEDISFLNLNLMSKVYPIGTVAEGTLTSMELVSGVIDYLTWFRSCIEYDAWIETQNALGRMK